MLQLLLKNKSKVFWSLLLIGLLIGIRLFEDQLFYDPFLAYFKSEYAHAKLPHFNVFKLFFSLGIRFYLNSVISLFLLYVIFKDTKIVKFSMLLYMVLGSILMISFIFVLTFFGEENKMTLFYLRRFIIQPIFILLFIPAFYYQKQVKK
ncbi:exosortase F system-associated protein [Flavobacterium sp. J49]|uniref:exosortase F system-associated membrane protein n=1 Tax=Flavobacterium sp. J49 TaxID=2718534 RepID=UPI0015946955|nr:exosortase F system-associated protein [Flavobacterium sp. J49]MBF6640547.1 exosortase F system-associated protein [Flavobacterium sp. J49]NIC01794.1 exosortase F system-associated protein [Flavobacterium sp. J49]